MPTPKAKAASKQISAVFLPDSHEFRMDGRGTSVLGNVQGDHVTAYGLVEAGFYRALLNLTESEVTELFEFKYRDSLRNRRNKVYDYISAIAVLDPNRHESLYDRIDELLDKYNKKRYHKQKLKEDVIHAGGSNLALADSESIFQFIELRYQENGRFMRELLSGIARVVMTYYNHIPHTAYFPIPGFEAPRNEGAGVRDALTGIEKSISKARPHAGIDSTPARTARADHLEEIINSSSALFHYPEIVDRELVVKSRRIKITCDQILEEHREKTQESKGGVAKKPRSNDKKKLIEVLAKHLYITFAVYPELNEIFDKKNDEENIVKSFVEAIIKDGTAKKGWPRFNNRANIDEIIGEVNTKLEDLKKKLKDDHYRTYQSYEDLKSSDDDEKGPSTRPRPIAAAILADKSKMVPLTVDEKKEFEELKKFKLIVDSRIDLPRAIKEELKKECPTLCADSGIAR